MDGFYSFIFYGLIIVAALLIISITILRIDWARHPEKYAKDVENYEKEEYWKKKRQDQQAAIKKAKEKEKARKRQQRVDKLNHYRAINGKGPVELKDERGKKKKKIRISPGRWSSPRTDFLFFLCQQPERLANILYRKQLQT